MPKNVLVAWATRYGSTEEVAHAVADDLLKQGFTVNARPMTEVQGVERFDAVVLGFALYMSRIHKDARRFLTTYKEQLTGVPVAVFCLGPVHADEKEFVEARRQLDKQLTAFPWFSPIALEIIGGRFDPQKLGLLRYVPAMRSVPASDARNWEAIHSWAYHLPAALQAAGTR